MRKSHFFTAITVLFATLLTACRTPQAAERETVYRTDTVVNTHIVTVATPPDSASIEALLRCDSAGNVLIDRLAIEQIKNAPDLLSAVTLGAEVARQMTALSDPDWERAKALNEAAVAEAKLRFGYQEAGSTSAQEAPKPKFCPNCGAPADGGKFCQHCGGKL